MTFQVTSPSVFVGRSWASSSRNSGGLPNLQNSHSWSPGARECHSAGWWKGQSRLILALQSRAGQWYHSQTLAQCPARHRDWENPVWDSVKGQAVVALESSKFLSSCPRCGHQSGLVRGPQTNEQVCESGIGKWWGERTRGAEIILLSRMSYDPHPH